MATLENALNIYTDGSSLGSPRRGGIGVRFVAVSASGEEQVHDFEFAGYKNATNNQMELHACIVGLSQAMKLDVASNVMQVVIYSDSEYVVANYKKAMFEWPKTRWRSRSGRPVLNADLWKELVRCIRKIRVRVEIKWVKAHSTDEHNKAVDKLARLSARMALKKPMTHVSVRRKWSSRSVEVGSVEMAGQRITIRIVTSEYMPVQRLWKYKYEVISQSSKYRGNVDIIFSKDFLSSGHTYYVRLNSDTRDPRIEKVFREIVSEEKQS